MGLFCIQVSSQWLDSGLPPSVVTPVKALETVENERSLSGLNKEAQEQHRDATEGGPVRSESGRDRHEYKGK